MAETSWLKIPELAATELVSEGPAKINTALTAIDKVNTGEQDYMQPGVVSSEDWSFTATINSATGELGSETATGGVAWLPGPSEASRLMRSVTTAAKLEKLKAPLLPAAGFYMTIGFELTATAWGSSATVSLVSGNEYSTQGAAEEHSPSTTPGKLRIRDVVVENAAGVYSIVVHKDRRAMASPVGNHGTASWGVISSSGVVEAGSDDFTVTTSGPGGTYELIWHNETTNAAYTVVATPLETEVTIAVLERTKTKAVVEMKKGASTVSSAFSFVAIAN